ncbi:hypothetical protein HZA73_06875 [candidate division TA06 bacterium]|nr:hypothetical protein [candidate division TA06 bacterium]
MTIEQSAKALRRAYITGVVISILIGLSQILRIIYSTPAVGVRDWIITIGSFGVCLGLVYGIYNKNRVCLIILTTIMLFALLLELVLAVTGKTQTVGEIFIDILTIASIYFLVQGTRGAFILHNDFKDKEILKG